MLKYATLLIDWYKINQRDLPWRNTDNPYLIWLSEIILQQTRVQQGLPYYYKFANQYPTLQNLANASQDEVLALWQGLGYYSRGRNLLKAAQQILNEYNGEFPNNFKELKKIIGIGDYTAAAIASFAFKEKIAVVDGNVNRVLSRLFGIHTPIDTPEGKKVFFELAQAFLHPTQHSTANQAIMEFGALQCTPKNPNCSVCPFLSICEAYHQNTITILPLKAKKMIKKDRYIVFWINEKNGKIEVIKRDENDIWAGMYQFPSLEKNTLVEIQQELANESLDAKEFKKHPLTHLNIYYCFKQAKSNTYNTSSQFIETTELINWGIPKIIKDYLLANLRFD
jgi:A/G-specific adenine glycosylase